MAISLGFSSNKSKGSSTSSATSMPIVPDWVGAPTRAITEQVGGLIGGDPYRFVAPQDAYTTKAADVAYSNLGAFDPQWQEASDIAHLVADLQAPTMSAANLLDNLDKYMNPYLEDVVGTTLKGYDKSAAADLAQMDLDLAGASAFGGSGAFLQRGQAKADVIDNRAMTEAGLRTDAFNKGAELSNLDAQRMQEANRANAEFKAQKQALNLQAAQLQGNLSQQRQNDTRSNISLLAGIGEQVRGIDNEIRQAPIDALGEYASILNALGLSDYFGQQVNETGTTKGKSSGLSLGFTYGGKD